MSARAAGAKAAARWEARTRRGQRAAAGPRRRNGGRPPPASTQHRSAGRGRDREAFARPIDPMEDDMEQFIHRQNIEHYRRLLSETEDETRRQQIAKLLAEEEAKEPSERQQRRSS